MKKRRVEYSSRPTEAFFVLTRAGLWEREPDSMACFPLTDDEWNEVYRLAVLQTLTGIVYRGMLRLPDNLLPPDAVLLRWVARVDRIERENQLMNGVIRELGDAFSAKGFRPVLQKGQGIAALYEYPLLRECGDIDFYFPDREQRAQADAWVEQQGISLCKEADGSVHYVWKGVTVEHHSRLIDLYSPFLQHYLKELEDEMGFVAVRPWQDCAQEWRVASPLLNLLMLNAHILKHALGWGIGLRQLCDMARAYYSWHECFERARLTEVYEKTGIGRWSKVLHGVLLDYLGMPADCLPDNGIPVSGYSLFHIIEQGGNFGQAARGGTASGGGWHRKLSTACSFLRNAQFAFQYAPWESAGIVSSLLKGQTR